MSGLALSLRRRASRRVRCRGIDAENGVEGVEGAAADGGARDDGRVDADIQTCAQPLGHLPGSIECVQGWPKDGRCVIMGVDGVRGGLALGRAEVLYNTERSWGERRSEATHSASCIASSIDIEHSTAGSRSAAVPAPVCLHFNGGEAREWSCPSAVSRYAE